MKKLLITGFEPFGGESTNPSWDAVTLLPDEINGYKLTKLLVPVTFGEGAEFIIKKAEEISPDVILSIGQAGGRGEVTPELVGINLRHGGIPDNRGYQPNDESITEGGADAYFSTLPVRKISEAISLSGIPSRVSYSAGAYVCNDVIYTLLSHCKDTPVRFGFIHVPYCDSQGHEPSMSMDMIVRAIKVAIETLDN